MTAQPLDPTSERGPEASMDRRRFLKSTLGAAGLALARSLLAACGGGGGTSGAAPTSAPAAKPAAPAAAPAAPAAASPAAGAARSGRLEMFSSCTTGGDEAG